MEHGRRKLSAFPLKTALLCGLCVAIFYCVLWKQLVAPASVQLPTLTSPMEASGNIIIGSTATGNTNPEGIPAVMLGEDGSLTFTMPQGQPPLVLDRPDDCQQIPWLIPHSCWRGKI